MFGKTSFFIVFLLALTTGVHSEGRFIGKFGLHPEGCEASRKCFLNEDLSYVDSDGDGWLATKGDETDGASIPEWAQSFIGPPYDPAFVRAAAVHDHYCGRHVKPMLRTHWVLLDALLTDGVPEFKAKMMYAAVMIGGPKWISVITGKACSVGQNCVQSVGELSVPADSRLSFAEDKTMIVHRGNTFGDPTTQKVIIDVLERLRRDPTSVSTAEIDRIARDVPANKYFFDNLNGIQVREVPKFEDR